LADLVGRVTVTGTSDASYNLRTPLVRHASLSVGSDRISLVGAESWGHSSFDSTGFNIFAIYKSGWSSILLTRWQLELWR
jgi:hypothetical protein